MISFGNVASSHSGFDTIENCVQKKSGIALGDREKNEFYSLHSAGIVTVCICNLVHTYKFRIIPKTAR